MLWPLFMAPRLIATAPRKRMRVVSEPPTAVPAESPLGFAWWLDETGDIISPLVQFVARVLDGRERGGNSKKKSRSEECWLAWYHSLDRQ